MSDFIIGDIVRVPGEQGKYKVKYFYKNGDMCVYGGTGGYEKASTILGHAEFRTFKPEQVKKARP